MFDKIRLSKFVGGSWVPDVDLEEIAETLGLNYDSETSVLYAGNNPDNGILVTVTSSQITFKLWGDGAEVTGSNTFTHGCALTNQNAVLSYKRSNNGVAFGVSSVVGVEMLKIIVSTGKSSLGVDKIGYICAAVSSANVYSLLEDGTYETTTYAMPGNTAIFSDTIISAAPFFSTSGNVIFDHVFMGICFNNRTNAQDIMVGEKNYVVLSRMQGATAPILLAL